MTLLRKTIRRETQTPADWRGKPIIVSIEPGDLIGFREKGRRKTFWLPIKSCYLLAVKAEVESELRRKRMERKKRNKS